MWIVLAHIVQLFDVHDEPGENPGLEGPSMFKQRASAAASVRIAAVGLALLGWVQPSGATPVYTLKGTIAVPPSADNPSGVLSALGFDLGTVDPSTQLLYLTDRSNNAINVISTRTNSFVEQIGVGLYTGLGSQGDGFAQSGPNGVSINTRADGTKLLVTSNGDSTVIRFSLAANGSTVLSTSPPISVAVPGTPVPQNRVDGVAYSPAHNTILAANGASSLPILTLINNATGAVVKSLVLDGTGGMPSGSGAEGTVYNTATGTFFVAVPQFGTTGAGGVVEIDAGTGALLHTYDFNALGLPASASCSPTGVAQGAGATLFVACIDTSGGTRSILLNPLNGGSIQVVNSISGGDAVAADPTRSVFLEASFLQPGGPVLGIIDAIAGTLAESIPTTPLAHSVEVDPVSGNVYVPFGASRPGSPDTVCPSGCIAVYAVDVPEPNPLPIMVLAIYALIACGLFGRRAGRIL